MPPDYLDDELASESAGEECGEVAHQMPPEHRGVSLKGRDSIIPNPLALTIPTTLFARERTGPPDIPGIATPLRAWNVCSRPSSPTGPVQLTPVDITGKASRSVPLAHPIAR